MAADVTTFQVLENGNRHLVVKWTDVAGGSGLSATTLVDATSTDYAVNVQGNAIPPGVHLKLTRCQYDVADQRVVLAWNATVPDTLLVLDGYGDLDFTGEGGLQNPVSDGADGSVLVSTLGSVAGSTASLVLWFTKGVPQLTTAAPEPPPDAEILTISVDLNASQIINLGTVPVEVIAAPGAGQIVMPLRVVARFRVGANPIAAGNVPIQLQWNNVGFPDAIASFFSSTDPGGNTLFSGPADQTMTATTQAVAQNDVPVNASVKIAAQATLSGGPDVGTCTLTITYARFPA